MDYLFLDLFGVVCDPDVMRKKYTQVMVSLLRQWYGGDREQWLRADDTTFGWYKKYWLAAQEMGGEYLEVWRKTNVEHLRRLFREAGVPLSLSDDEVFELDRKLTYEVTSRIDATYPDTKQSIEKIHSKGVGMYLCTSSDDLYVRGVLEASGLSGFFAGALTSNLLDEWKGTEKYWHRAIRLVSGKWRECSVVDNSIYCLRNAESVGCTTVWVNRERKPKDESFSPDFEIHSLSALPSLIGTLLF